MTVFAYLLVLFAFILLGTAIAYTFLRLFNKIGPKNGEDAGTIGAVLWLVALLGSLFLFKGAYSILSSLQ